MKREDRLNKEFDLMFDLKTYGELYDLIEDKPSHSDATPKNLVDTFISLGEQVPIQLLSYRYNHFKHGDKVLYISKVAEPRHGYTYVGLHPFRNGHIICDPYIGMPIHVDKTQMDYGNWESLE